MDHCRKHRSYRSLACMKRLQTWFPEGTYRHASLSRLSRLEPSDKVAFGTNSSSVTLQRLFYLSSCWYLHRLRWPSRSANCQENTDGNFLYDASNGSEQTDKEVRAGVELPGSRPQNARRVIGRVRHLRPGVKQRRSVAGGFWTPVRHGSWSQGSCYRIRRQTFDRRPRIFFVETSQAAVAAGSAVGSRVISNAVKPLQSVDNETYQA